SGAKWKAGNTAVSNLSETEKKGLFGLQLPPGADEHFVNRAPSKFRGPDALDWRNKDGKHYVSPILSQGSYGSYVAFGSIGTRETQLNITRNMPDSPFSLSPQHLFSCGGGTCKKGWQLIFAGEYLKNTGVVDEACFPYASGTSGNDTPCANACSD